MCRKGGSIDQRIVLCVLRILRILKIEILCLCIGPRAGKRYISIEGLEMLICETTDIVGIVNITAGIVGILSILGILSVWFPFLGGGGSIGSECRDDRRACGGLLLCLLRLLLVLLLLG